jgi:ribosomal protein S18 acetylase RimI-like enzyme
VPDPGAVSWRRADDEDELVTLMARVLAASVDRRHEALVRDFGSRAVAVAMVEDALSGHTYQGDPTWWSVIDVDGVPSGFVLPVVFKGCDHDELDEGTIYHIGVVPEHRGHSLGHLLLGRATDFLLDRGVWQIAADTAAENAPMIHLFERQGWTRRPPTDSTGHPLPGLPGCG